MTFQRKKIGKKKLSEKGMRSAVGDRRLVGLLAHARNSRALAVGCRSDGTWLSRVDGNRDTVYPWSSCPARASEASKGRMVCSKR